MREKIKLKKVMLWIFFLPIMIVMTVARKENWSFKKKAAIIAGVIVIMAAAGATGQSDSAFQEANVAASIPTTEAATVLDKGSEIVKEIEQTAEQVQPDPPEETTAGESKAAAQLKVHFLNVGQALSVLIQDEYGNELLYDMGNDADAPFISNYLKKAGVGSIEYMVNSHPHEDHIGGMDDLLKAFEVDTVIMSNLTYETKAYKEVVDLLIQKNIKVSDPVPGETYQVGSWSFEIIGPMKTAYDETNNYSVVIKVTNGSQSVLLTGDAEVDSEHEIISSGSELKADILQVPHHGSGSSSSSQFIKQISPQYAVISVGSDNSYGHPDNLVVNRLELMGIKTYRTDTDGTVVFTIDGGEIKAETFSDIGNSSKSSSDKPEAAEGEAAQKTTEIQTTEKPAPSDKNGIIISALDKHAEYIIIKNSSSEVKDVGGWRVVSEKGNQAFVFPAGYVLQPGQECKLTSGAIAGTGDFTMANTDIWNNSSSDPGVLYDASDVEIDRMN